MDARERYFWDLTGYLVVRNVLTAEELSECNAAIDHCMERTAARPRQRRHPRQVQRAPRQPANRPSPTCSNYPIPTANPSAAYWSIPKSSAASTQCAARGSATTTAPGSPTVPREPRASSCTARASPIDPTWPTITKTASSTALAVTVTWQLADCKAGDGGFACVPGSHKAKFPMPRRRALLRRANGRGPPARAPSRRRHFLHGRSPNPRHPTLAKRCAAPTLPSTSTPAAPPPARRLHRVSRARSLLGRSYRRGDDTRATRRHVTAPVPV